jgi:hypothetical protein
MSSGGLHVNYPLFLSFLNETLILTDFLKKYPKLKLHENPIKWEPSFSMRINEHTDGQTYMTKLVLAFRNFVNAPKKWEESGQSTATTLCSGLLYITIRVSALTKAITKHSQNTCRKSPSIQHDKL